jgi:acetoacetyl-[acyl-carrier protein] synthase
MGRQRLPVIVGFGGINGAGRGSAHHAFGRMVHSALPEAARERIFASLANLMGLESGAGNEQFILDHTLVRRVEHNHFDVDFVDWNQRFPTESNGHPVNFDIARKHLPDTIPPDWVVTNTSVTHANVQIVGQQDFLLPTHREFEVKAAGQLPTGFDPGTLYPSRSHPRGLQMTVYAASDALGSLGIDWDTVCRHVAVDQISVYAGSAMGQLDNAGAGGMMKARYQGQRVTSKYCPLSLAEMPADFINAYVLGSLGSTGASLGACASFLYNLRNGIEDIRSGRARVAFVGSAEAPVNPESVARSPARLSPVLRQLRIYHRRVFADGGVVRRRAGDATGGDDFWRRHRRVRQRRRPQEIHLRPRGGQLHHHGQGGGSGPGDRGRRWCTPGWPGTGPRHGYPTESYQRG